MDYCSFLHNLCELFILDDDVVDNEDLIMWIMSLGEPSSSSILLMKDKGNTIFKQGNFSLASSLYKQALNFLCYVGLRPSSDHQTFSSLALSLVLNLAACELKSSHFDLASRYCKFILHFDPSNVKALYRRGLAYKQLKLLKDAQEDFQHVLKLEFNNSDAKRELLAVTDQLAMNSNGKRTAYSFDPLGSIFKGKKPVPSKGVVDYTNEASCSSSSKTESSFADEFSGPMVLDNTCEVSPSPVVENTKVVVDRSTINSNGKRDGSTFDPLAKEWKGKKPLLSPVSTDDCIPPISPDVPMDYVSSSAPCEALKDSAGYNSTSSDSPKPSHLHFTNKKRPHNRLSLSSQDYANLLHGKNLGFFHPRSMSYLGVRTLNSKTIQTGTPHEEISGSAEVPTTSPLSENFFNPLNVKHSESVELVQEEVIIQVDMKSHEDNTVQEEVVLQIAKKKRVSSDSAQVSKVSAVQFQFVAVRDNKNNKTRRCRRKVAYSPRRSHVSQASIRMKKRSSVSVDFSLCICRYTKEIAAVRRAKRKGTDQFHFDDFYHPPYKKSRLTFSVSSSCNVSMVRWFSSSLQNSSIPGFVV